MANDTQDGTAMGAEQVGKNGKDVARLAYELYERRGHDPGHALDDWLEAEFKVKQHPQPRFRLEWLEPERPTRRHPSLSQGLAIGLVLLGSVVVGVIVVSHLTPATPQVQVARAPVMADQLALTSGYRALLFRPAFPGH